jgi:hypothetical protein
MGGQMNTDAGPLKMLTDAKETKGRIDSGFTIRVNPFHPWLFLFSGRSCRARPCSRTEFHRSTTVLPPSYHRRTTVGKAESRK